MRPETREERRDLEQFSDIFWAVEWIECKRSLERFARHCKTKDEHAGGITDRNLDQDAAPNIWETLRRKEDETIRYFPTREERPHIWFVLDRCLTEPLLWVEKSRQMQVTWGICLYLLWQAKFHSNKLVFAQSKKETDAANLVFNQSPEVGRISFMESNLPEELKSIDFSTAASFGKLRFPNGSQIMGVPEGADIIRSYTASVIFEDEACFQPEIENAFAAAMPSVKGGGQLILVSTPWPQPFLLELRKP